MVNIPKVCFHAASMRLSISTVLLGGYLKLFDLDRQQSKTLTDIFVQVYRDPVTFPLFCLNHPAAHAWESLFRQFVLGNVSHRVERHSG
jgi:hypothetical protein